MRSCHSPMAGIDAADYFHSPVHKAVVTRDHAALEKILASIPCISLPSPTLTEVESIAEEEKANAVSAVIDRRDVPKRETPLHLAIKLGDGTAVQMLMAAGADSSLQNLQGWSPLQEAICAREERIAKIILRHYQFIAWVKWRRRMPRIVAAMNRMRDFYMEINFHFESSVIPFISRIAPSDTYKIWKKGSNLRADMTLSGFDGLKIKRAKQSVLFFGEGSVGGKVKPGSLYIISHKDKEVLDALDRAGGMVSDAELQQEFDALSRTSVLRPGLDVTGAVLVPQLTWRNQQRSEMVGPWKSKVYALHNVVVSMKSRHVSGAINDEDLSTTCKNDEEDAAFGDMLTEEERKRLETVLKMENSDSADFDEQKDQGLVVDMAYGGSSHVNKEGNGELEHWNNGEASNHDVEKKDLTSKEPLFGEEKVNDLLEGSSEMPNKQAMNSNDSSINESKEIGASLEDAHQHKESEREIEYSKGLKPVLWLSPDFPLQTQELLPLLDILANKVKAVRRLRELLTTKLPSGTFPVKMGTSEFSLRPTSM
ncbi:ankyrin repeat domain-containing protein 13C-B-like isoform X2 [Phalaenopsis equestris]|uniref:ankyrin repeat domain-containing protein 13C-B-like isoform X2 n=1 Tax=Phalaenopsis equestris TaxID=78828 RepID=UPI0009E58659|nr:ankyrin repeat domain-containing protein 13C-B-like isoform X2 [Phalaenopsis equestris]